MPLPHLTPDESKTLWDILKWVGTICLGAVGFGAAAQRMRSDIRTVKNIVLDEHGNSNVVSLSQCDRKRDMCGKDLKDRRKNDRVDLTREFQNIHAAITGLTEQFATLAATSAGQERVLTLISKNLELRLKGEGEINGGHIGKAKSS